MNPDHLKILMHGADAWRAWRRKNCSVKPDLSDADLDGANLDGANLNGTNLDGAYLNGADLSEADLRRAPSKFRCRRICDIDWPMDSRLRSP